MSNNRDEMLERVKRFVEGDERFLSLAVGGSYITKEMDEYSDLDFVIVVSDKCYDNVMAERKEIVESFGTLLSAFTGEHVGEPRLIIALYDNPLLHVDFKFVALKDAAQRVENPVIIVDKEGSLAQVFQTQLAEYPQPDIQWIEDRFWIWVHYGVTKIARGELFEALDLISALRQMVLSPLILQQAGKRPQGNRKIEIYCPDYTSRLAKTVADYSRESCFSALLQEVQLYDELRQSIASDETILKEKARVSAIAFLQSVMNTV